MKQLAFDFIDGREPSLRDLMRQAGIETSTDTAKRHSEARKQRLQQRSDPARRWVDSSRVPSDHRAS